MNACHKQLTTRIIGKPFAKLDKAAQHHVMQHIVVIGGIVAGFQFFGPFDNLAVARRFISTRTDGETAQIVTLKPVVDMPEPRPSQIVTARKPGRRDGDSR